VLAVRKQRNLAENSIKLEAARGRQLKKHFGGTRVASIGIEEIRAYQAARLRTVSARTVNLETKVLRFVMKEAKTWARVGEEFENLAEKRPAVGRALTDPEQRLLLETARSKPAWDAAFLGALAASQTTMRGHELKNLRLRDVDLINAEVTASVSKTEGGTGRVVPLTDVGVWAFARLLERAAALGSVLPEHFLFPRCRSKETRNPIRGTGYDPSRPQKGWRTAWRNLTKEAVRRAEEAGIDPAPLRGFRFHDLRHTSITRLAESGKADATTMAISGHLSKAMLDH
jgi:integrase